MARAIDCPTHCRKGIKWVANLCIFNCISLHFSIAKYRSKDRYKCLYFDGDGFVMLYKRLDNGKLQWPRNEKEVRNLSQQELRWLLEGLSIQQPKAIQPSQKGQF
jgi:transposase